MSNRPSMKSIIENARAMRTASLSDRKKKPIAPTSATPPHHTPTPKSPPPLQSQSLLFDQQSQYSSYQVPPYSNLSYQFSQPISHYPMTAIQYNPHESAQFSNLSRMSYQMGHLGFHGSRQEAISQQQAVFQARDKERPRKGSNQIGIEILGVINEEMMKNCGRPGKIAKIRDQMEKELQYLRIRKKFNFVQLLEGI